MRNTIILILALFAGTAFAQAPVIDSMLIDESKGILSVYGDFGSVQGKIWCDSVEFPVLSWSASLVTATIPDTGKGSAGGVVVEGRGEFSSQRFITLWNGEISSYHYEQHSRPDSYGKALRFRLRIDLQSLLLRNSTELILARLNRYSSEFGNHEYGNQFDPNIGYEVYRSYSGSVNVNNSDTVHEIGFLCNCVVNTSSKRLSFYISSVRGMIGSLSYRTKNDYVYTTYEYVISDYIAYAQLDSFFQIIPIDTVVGPSHIYEMYKTYGTENFLPFKTISRQYNPSTISPKNEFFNIGTNDILLQWNSLKYMDSYHIQLSKDSIINGQRAGQAQQGFSYIVDTIVSSLDFALPSLEKNTKYYWRVCGVNTEGESRWSEVWSFTTGTSTDVKQERAKSISLACYPNPAINELTIVTTEPRRLLLYDVTGKIIKSEQATSNQTKWDVSLLPNGTYILGTSSGEMQVVLVVK